jgi:hypothetical protein
MSGRWAILARNLSHFWLEHWKFIVTTALAIINLARK